PSTLLIAPRLHYLMPVVLFLITLTAAGLGSWPRWRGVWARLERPLPLLGLFAVLLAVTPNRAHGWNVQALFAKQPAPPLLLEQRTVAALKLLPIQGSP